MRLDELFDQTYPLKTLDQKDGRWVGTFEVKSGLVYRVSVTEWADRIAEVIFSARDEDGPRLDTIGTGDQFLVFSTVMKFVRRYARECDPKEVQFTADADEPSRTRLYRRIAERELPQGYYLRVEDLGRGIVFRMKKITDAAE